MDVVKNILENNKYEYELIYHDKPILTAQQGADYFGIEIGQTAPTLIIKADNGFFVLIKSGSRDHIDFEQIAKKLDCKQVKMASRYEVKKATGFDVGSVPMIGITLPFIVDDQLLSYPFVYGGSGQPTRTLKIEPRTLQQLNKVVAIIK
jgi:prolyl-tRNA editing enzyme YbaK/EbsC (Cys-tRNA(Pro) deacylase)